VSDGSDEKRQISTVAAVIVAVAIGAAMAYFGFRLASFGVYAFSEDELLLGVLAFVAGCVLIGLPVAVLTSQVVALLRRRR
jgi:biotin transporter BioY